MSDRFHDHARLGALRFRRSPDGPFVDDSELSAPPVARLRELEESARQLEQPGAEERAEYARWLALLTAPGSSLGGARPKASFIDQDGSLWLAKFPSREDRRDVGAWEFLLHQLARRLVFNLMAGNRDDHLRNHGFIRVKGGGGSRRPST